MKLSTKIREMAGLSRLDRCPIEIVPGDQAPIEVGESWYFRTKGGDRISHPSSYYKKGWSNMVYVPATRRIEVGQDFLLGLQARSFLLDS